MSLTIQRKYQPGDLPPDGYMAWHEWAEVQRKAGIRQTQCRACRLWFTPQEMSAQTRRTPVTGECANCAVRR